MPGKRRVFTTRVEPVSPPYIPIARDGWWRRRALPPGPQRLFHAPFITIVSKLTVYDLGCPGRGFKGFHESWDRSEVLFGGSERPRIRQTAFDVGRGHPDRMQPFVHCAFLAIDAKSAP